MLSAHVRVALLAVGAAFVVVGSLAACGGSFVGVGDTSPGSDGSASDGTAPGDGGAADGNPPGCPSSQPQGTCSGPLNCSYGCTFCTCAGGSWSCSAPGCYGGCSPTPPKDGASCGGCCGPSVGMTCEYACPGDAGTLQATCVGLGGTSGTWKVGSCPSGGRTVTCGSSVCNLDTGQACCDTIRADASTHTCGPIASGSFCVTGAVEECDDKGDCPPGNVCCLQFQAQGIGAACMPTCITNVERYQACKTSVECDNGGPCKEYACVAGETVQTCEKPLECQ